MPPWLVKALGLVEPVTEVLPAAKALGEEIATEFASADSVEKKVIEIAGDLTTFAGEIAKALTANTPAAQPQP